MEIHFQYHTLWIIAVIIGAAAWAYFLYRKKTSIFTVKRRLLLAFFRFFSLLILGLLLLRPTIFTRNQEVEKPYFFLAFDNSESVLNETDSAEMARFYSEVENVFKKALDSDYRIRKFAFDGDIKEENAADFSGKSTDIAQSIQFPQKRYGRERSAGILLVSDGIFNKGGDPAVLATQLPYPVISLTVGDTAAPTDAVLDQVQHNLFAYTGSKVEISGDFRFRRLAGKEAKIRLSGNGQLIQEKSIRIPQEDAFTKSSSFIVDVGEEAGIRKYTLSVQPFQEEKNTANNQQDFYIEVLESKKKVHLISKGPHPDLGAIRKSLEAQGNYELLFLRPTELTTDIEMPDLAVVFQANVPFTYLEALQRKGGGILLFAGGEMDMADYNDMGILSKDPRKTPSPDFARPIFSSNFPYFSLPEKWSENTFTPIESPYAELRFRQAHIMAYQEIQSVRTERPLIAGGVVDEQPWMLVNGSGIWLWRGDVFRADGNHRRFDEWVASVARFLGSFEQKERFQLTHPQRFSDDESVRITARVYDAAFTPSHRHEVDVQLFDENEQAYTYNFTAIGDQYQLKVNGLSPGSYRYRAKARFSDEELTKEGRFIVESFQLEKIDLQARSFVMQQIARESGGASFDRSQIDEMQRYIAEMERQKPIVRERLDQKSLINRKLAFWFIIIFLTAEWFLRRYFGSY